MIYTIFFKITIIRLFRNHANSDHVPSFSSLDVWNVRPTTSGVYAITVTTSIYHSRISCSVPLCLSDNINISGHIVLLFMMLTAVNKVRKQIHCLCIEVFNANKAKQQNLLASQANFQNFDVIISIGSNAVAAYTGNNHACLRQ